MNIDQLIKAQKLMTQAISCATNSLSNHRTVTEAKSHMHQAIANLDKARKIQMQRKVENSKPPVGHTQVAEFTNYSYSKEAQEAIMKTLGMLDSMVAEEKKVLNDLEAKVSQSQKPNPSLLKD